jgi:hypothetical protein
MEEKGDRNEQRTPPLALEQALEVEDGKLVLQGKISADTSQINKFTMICFLTEAVLMATLVVLCLAALPLFAGHVCLLYGFYFGGKEEKLRKEYLDAGIGLEGFVVSCVSSGTDEGGDALYDDSTIQYAATDSADCYALTIPSGRKEYHVHEQVPIVVLFGIPQIGRRASTCENSSENSNCFIRYFLLLAWGLFWAPNMSRIVAYMIVNPDMDNYHVTFLEILTVFCVLLAIPFPCHVVCLFASHDDPAGQTFASRPGF